MDNGAILYAQYLNGDDKALELLVQAYGDNLVRFAYCFVKDFATAEDVAEDTFATLIIKRKRFSPHASFKTYLYKIARNKCLDFLRFHKRFTPLNDYENLLAGDSVEESVDKSEREKIVRACVQQLPKQYADVLFLIYIEEFSVDETSKIMDKNVKQVYNLLARAKTSLRTLLINEGIKYEDI